jgi:hypothetical protein
MTLQDQQNMTMLSEQFEAAKAWSLLDTRPVLFDDRCFWFGMFMHKNVAFILASNILMKVPITPKMKLELYDQQRELCDEVRREGIKLWFDITQYTPDGMLKHIHSILYSKSDELKMIRDSLSGKDLVVHFFQQNQ